MECEGRPHFRYPDDTRSAWLWLRQPHSALGGRPPLAVLKNGGKEAVVRAAKRDASYD